MNKTVFAILTLFNHFGIPSFIQGDAKTGIIHIVLTLFGGIVGLWNFVMGILLAIEIFKMTDEEYEAKKGTFYKGIGKDII
ncbi:MAG: hypothetical protein IKT46_09125 [Clostridia bacterium]|nr:hypothetical protein [Clostridia bacterium]